MAQKIDSIYYELELRVNQLLAGSKDVERAGGQMAAAMETATDQLVRLTAELLKLPGGAREVQQLIQPLDQVADAAALAAAQAANLRAQLDPMAAGMSRAGDEAARYRVLMAGVSEAGAAAASGVSRLSTSAEGGAQASHKLRAGLVGLATQATGTNRAVSDLAQSLLLFGVGSSAVLGIAAGIAIIAAVYDKVTASARAAKKSIEETAAALRQSIESAPVFQAVLAQAAASEELAHAKARLAEQTKPQTVTNRFGTQTIPGAAADPALVQAVHDAQFNFEQKALITDRARKAEAEGREKDLTDLKAKAEATAAAVAAFELQVIDATAKATKTLLDDAKVALDRFDQETDAKRAKLVEDKAPPAQLRKFDTAAQFARTSFEQAIGEAQFGDFIAAQLKEDEGLIKTAGEGLGNSLADGIMAATKDRLAGLDAEIASLTALRDANPDTRERPQIEATINALLGVRQGLQARLNALAGAGSRSAIETAKAEGDAANAAQERTRHLRDLAQNIESGVRGALQLAGAFGVVDQATASILTNLTQVGASLPVLLDAIGRIGPATKAADTAARSAATGDAISAGLAILGGLAGLIAGGGDSPAERARREALQANTAELARVRDALLHGTLNVQSGTAEQQATVAAQGIVAETGGKSIDLLLPAQQKRISDALDAAGISEAQFNAILEAHGVHPTGDARDIGVIAKQFLDLGPFLQSGKVPADFQSQTAFLGLQAQVNDLTAQQQFEALRGLHSPGGVVVRNPFTGQPLLTKEPTGSPAITRALAGLDLSLAADREKGQAALSELLRQAFQPGLSLADLGGLSLTEFERAIAQFSDLIQQAGQEQAAGVAGQTSSFSVSRSVTEVTGNRLVDGIGTTNLYLSGINADTTAIRALISQLAVPPLFLNPPPLPASFTAAASPAAAPVTINLTFAPGAIQVTGLPGQDPVAIAEQVAQRTSDRVVRDLGPALGYRKLMTGNVELL